MPRNPTSPDQRRRGLALARRLSEHREATHKTQDQIATAAHISTDTLRSLEQGKSANPGVFFIVDIARELGVTVEELTK